MDYNYNYYNIKRRSGTKNYNVRSKKHGLKLGVCLGIFALAVGVKLVMPEFSRDMSAQVLTVLDSSVDYRAAFAGGHCGSEKQRSS